MDSQVQDEPNWQKWVKFPFDKKNLEKAEHILSTSDDPRIVRFHDNKYPITNFIEFTVPDTKDPSIQLKLKTYRYPAYHDLAEKGPVKGILFMVHGFKDYTGRFAHFAKMLSEEGYDFFGFDARGHGQSEGDPAFIPSIHLMADEHILFHKKILQQFYPDQNSRPPVHIFSHSVGCMFTMNFLTRTDIELPEYASVTLLGPFFGLPNKGGMFQMKLLSWVNFFKKGLYTPSIEVPEKLIPDQYYHWCYDKNHVIQKKYIPYHTILQFYAELKVFNQLLANSSAKSKGKQAKEVPGRRLYCDIPQPISIHYCGDDLMVDNKVIKATYETFHPDRREFVHLDKTDHVPTSDGVKSRIVADHALKWMTANSSEPKL